MESDLHLDDLLRQIVPSVCRARKVPCNEVPRLEWEARRRYLRRPCPPDERPALLSRIVRNLANDFHREDRLRPPPERHGRRLDLAPVEVLHRCADADASVSSSVEMAEISAALDELLQHDDGPIRRSVLTYLTAGGDMSRAAAKCGIPLRTLHMHLSRFRRSIVGPAETFAFQHGDPLEAALTQVPRLLAIRTLLSALGQRFGCNKALLTCQAALADYAGDNLAAPRFLRQAEQESGPLSLSFFVLKAEVLNHAGRPREAHRLLSDLGGAFSCCTRPLRWLREYQTCVMLMQFAEPDLVRSQMSNLRESAPSEEHATAARHQLANLALRRPGCCPEEALSEFEYLIRTRPPGHRLAYERRGAARACLRMGRVDLAMEHYAEALEIAHRYSFGRYAALIQEEMLQREW